MSARKQRTAAASGFERRWLLGLLGVTVALFGVTGVVEGPRVARQVWGMVGVTRVESHAPVICAAAAESALDPCWLAGIMYCESRGQVDAVSGAGALGLFQLMPTAAADAAKKLRLPEPTRDQLLSDPLLNARLAAVHLSWLYRKEGPDLERVMVAYNAGRGKLAKWLKESGGWDAWRARQVRDQDSGTLKYAQEVIEFTERFRERGVVVAGVNDAMAPLAQESR